ncbi:hypothetical protein SOVF_105330 [Spinacia oleracea]|nr:hypothetical protein SOVF_105330 [Spinacia oleracea]
MDGLPVECIATIISLTNPRDACCFASISRTFNSAANSDLVWDRFLPSDYRNILAQFDGGDHHQSLLDSSTSKKHLYMNLVDTPLLIDGGMMIFWVEKSTGKKCYTISAMKLHIHCSSRYNCRVESNYVPKSRFSEVVRVMNVQRINELGERIRTSMLSPNTKYTVYFVFRVENYSWNPRFQDPLRVKVEKFSPYEIKAVRGKVYVDRPDPKRAAMLKKNVVTCYSYLDKMGAEEEEEDSVKLPEKRRDGWMEKGLRFKEGEREMPTLTKLFSMEEAAQHNTKDDCWVVIDGKVYDVSSYLDDHPGGDDVLLSATGKDAKEEFEDAGHSQDARDEMEKYFVGELIPSDETTPEPVQEKVGTIQKIKDLSLQYWAAPVAIIGISIVVGFLYLRKK